MWWPISASADRQSAATLAQVLTMNRSIQRLSAFFLLSLVFSGCGPAGKGPSSRAPEKPKVESTLSVTTISPKAYKSLGIVSEQIHTDKTQEFVQLTGWIMAPQGKEVRSASRWPPRNFCNKPTANR
jgi:hypothetical protein